MKWTQGAWLVAVLAMCSADAMGAETAGAMVKASAREIPVAYQVDVVVVGGSTGAVSAAVAAAQNGAKVFLAAPRPYLGEDMCATLRLWLDEGEKPSGPLAEKLFAGKDTASKLFDVRDLVSFKYEADKPTAARHKDTDPPGVLADQRWHSASQESVQYDDDVNLTVDLLSEQELKKAGVLVYHKSDYQVESVTVFASPDKKTWKEVAVVKNEKPEQATVNEEAISLLTAMTGKTRYLRFFVKRAPGSKRVLVGEIVALKAVPPQTQPVRLFEPMHIKRTLDEALLEAKVDFLFGCLVTDVLRDADGNPCGIVMVNRAGRQAVLAKAIVDATDRAWVARMAGAQAKPFPAGEQTLKRVVIGGEARTGANATARAVGQPWVAKVKIGPKGKEEVVTRSYQTIEYTLRLPMQDGSYASWAKAEQAARDLTYHPEQQFASDVLFQAPPDPIKGQKSLTGGWQGIDKLDVAAFRPAGVPRLYVLSGCADVSREQAEKLLRPTALIEMGSRIGAAAAAEAKSLAATKGMGRDYGVKQLRNREIAGIQAVPGQDYGVKQLRNHPALPTAALGPVLATGDVKESLASLRPWQKVSTIRQDERLLPVLGAYDVVVVGGGTSGAPAGIAAARQGAKTLVVEYLHGLGGVGTLGLITIYCAGNRVGFTKEVQAGQSSWEVEPKMEWWRTELRKAGGELWFGALGCGAFVDGRQVKGVIVATPEGRGVALAKVVIDSTGNSDIAAAAGAACVQTDETDLAMQGTGLPFRNLGSRYVNTDFTVADETDMLDVWHLFVYAKTKYKSAFDLGQLIDTRERRRIVGDFTMTLLDQINKRTYPDTIVESQSPFDTHGYAVDPYCALATPPSMRTHTPYRCLLPRGWDGILATGLGMSAHRDAMPVLRMQPDLQNQGYAAGVAAAMAARKGVPLRGIDIRELQKHLVDIGNLPPSVLTDKDSYPIPTERLMLAVENVRNGYKDVGTLLASPEQALPLLQDAYEAGAPKEKLTHAHIMGILGDATGLPTLIAAVDAMPEWDEGWQFRAMGQFGRDMSWLDSLILAMGRTRDRRAVPPILAKVKLLDVTKAFSHHRAVGLALEMLADPAAAGPLADLLAKPGMSGHAVLSVDAAKRQPGSPTETQVRANSLREIVLARALYRCGDKDGLGRKILEQYANDMRGHFARHASAVLQR